MYTPESRANQEGRVFPPREKISGVGKRQKKAALEARSVLGKVVAALVLKEMVLTTFGGKGNLYSLAPLTSKQTHNKVKGFVGT